jgi:two-component system chemotaxis response regulator CheB
MAEKIKVMIVDDSALVRQVVSQALATDSGIEVIATASDPIFALEKMKTKWPDVLIVDIEMPRMDGISFLKKIMSERPTPVVICSSLAEQGAQATFEALSAGAVAIITKPKVGLKSFLEDSSNDIVQAVRSAARANMRALSNSVRSGSSAAPVSNFDRPKNTADVMLSPGVNRALERTTDQLIAIGTSTGGTQALEAVLTKLPATSLGIVIVQHMPEKFTAMFAERFHLLASGRSFFRHSGP